MALDDRRLVKISKYLARHLRHDPARLGLTLAPGGWVAVTDLLDACAAHNFPITREELGDLIHANLGNPMPFLNTELSEDPWALQLVG